MKNGLFLNRNFQFMTAGQVVSTFGDTLYLIVISWMAANVTKSNIQLSLISICDMLPSIILGIFSGAIVDRYSSKKIMIIADIARSILILFFIFVILNGCLKIGAIYILTFLIGFLQGLYNPAQFSLVPQIIKEENLKEANAISSVALNIATIVGNSLGGFVISICGILGTLWINCFTFFFSSLCTNKIIYQDEKSAIVNEGLVIEIFDSIKYIKNNIRFLQYILLSISLNLISGAFYIMPLFIKNILNNDIKVYGLIEGVGALGIMIGALIIVKMRNGRFYNIMIISGLGEGICFLGIAQSKNIIFIMILRFLLGVCNAIFNVIFLTILQQEVKDEYIGRMYTTSFMLSTLSLPIAAVLSGRLADKIGLRNAWTIFGIITIVCIGINYFIKKKGDVL